MTPLTQILSIARAGNPARAWGLFRSAGWDERTDDPKALTLKGRLLKDQAKAAQGSERVRLYGLAAAAYAAAAAIQQTSYPLINAATLALLGGKPERAVQLAGNVLDLLEDNPQDAETEYWLDATRAEALVLLGKEAEARAVLKNAMAKAPQAWEDHAATIGQFGLIIAEQGGDAEWLDRHRPPCSLHFSGLIGLGERDIKLSREVDDIIAREKPGFGVGALAAGADIVIAEALDTAGAELHITLPYPVDRFRELSVAPFGEAWLPRFDRLIERAATVNAMIEMPGTGERPLGVAITLGNQVSMGQAIRNAGVLQSHAKALTIIGNGEQPRQQCKAWQDSGHDLLVLEAKRAVNIARAPRGQDEPQRLSSILWLENADAATLDQFQSSDGGYFRIDQDLAANCSTALELLQRSNGNVTAAIIWDIFDPDDPGAAMLQQAKDLAKASDKGTLLTDHKTAMAFAMNEYFAAPSSHTHRIEEIGELNTAYGAIPIWSIS